MSEQKPSTNVTNPSAELKGYRRPSSSAIHKPQLILLVGFPGVGKSHYLTDPNGLKKDFPALEQRGYEIISTDRIIQDLIDNATIHDDGYRTVTIKGEDRGAKQADTSIRIKAEPEKPLFDQVKEKMGDEIRQVKNKLLKEAASKKNILL